MSQCTCYNQLPPIYKGDDATIKLAVVHNDGTKMNFNGKTVTFIVKKLKTQEDTDAVITKTYTPEIDKEELDIELTDTETNIEPGTYWWGVRVEYDNYQTTEGEGQVEIVQGPFYGN